MSKWQNKLTWDWYEAAFNWVGDEATNRGFRMVKGMIWTYTQNKLGLSAYNDKKWMLPDGIHTEPTEYHLQEEE